MSAIQLIQANEDREEELRIERVTFALEHPPLRSLSEAVNICPGYGAEDCGDEIPKGTELCVSCKRADDRHWQEKLWEADGEDWRLVSFPSLTDEGE